MSSSAISWKYQETPEARYKNGNNGTLVEHRGANEILIMRLPDIYNQALVPLPISEQHSLSHCAWLQAVAIQRSLIFPLPNPHVPRSKRCLQCHIIPRVAVKNKRPWACVNECFSDRNVSQNRDGCIYLSTRNDTAPASCVC